MRERSNKVLLLASVLIVLHIRSFSSEETQDDEVSRKSKQTIYNSNLYLDHTIT